MATKQNEENIQFNTGMYKFNLPISILIEIACSIDLISLYYNGLYDEEIPLLKSLHSLINCLVKPYHIICSLIIAYGCAAATTVKAAKKMFSCQTSYSVQMYSVSC